MAASKPHPIHRLHLPLLVPVIGLLLVVVIVGLAAGMSLLSRSQDLGSKAAPATTLAMTTPNTTVSPNQIFTVNIEATTNQNLVKAVDVGLRYDKQYLELVKMEKGEFAAKGQEIINSINAAAGMATYSVIVPTTASPPYFQGQGVVMKATFRALQIADATKIAFAAEDTTVGAQNESTDAISLQSDITLKITTGVVNPTPTTIPTTAEFFVYSYEACQNGNSNGASTYFVWHSNRYPNIKSIDISLKSDFSEFANKEVANPKALPNGFAMTDGTNFRWYNSSKGAFVFEPDVTYYVRLFYDNRHSAVATYKVPKCAGIGGTNYKQCNETCTNNDECASNLYCYNSQCRRINNPNNTSCVLPPDQGIKRSCNEYCADNTECATGLTCWYNRCRAPEKTDDSSCAAWVKPNQTSCNKYCADSSECSDGLSCWYNRCRNPKNVEDIACRTLVTPGVVEGCNESCSVNADCAANLRCYSGQCRLLTNPGNTRCQPPQPTRQSVNNKGGYDYEDEDDSEDTTAAPTTRPTAKPSVSPTTMASPSATPKVSVVLNTSPSPKVSGKPTTKPSAKPTTAKLVNDFPDKTTTTTQTSGAAKSPFSAVPLILGIIIVAVAAVLGIPRLLSLLQSKSGQPLVQPPMGGTPPSSPVAPGSGISPTTSQPPVSKPLDQGFGRPISSSTPPEK